MLKLQFARFAALSALCAFTLAYLGLALLCGTAGIRAQQFGTDNLRRAYAYDIEKYGFTYLGYMPTDATALYVLAGIFLLGACLFLAFTFRTGDYFARAISEAGLSVTLYGSPGLLSYQRSARIREAHARANTPYTPPMPRA